ncbi:MULTISPECIES: transposase [Anoxybacillus]|uniref:transposase n=1 Tax=Anoxybacillus TaxID=150247 RepID=UPI003158BBB5
MVSIENPRGSLLEKRVSRHRDAEDESDSLSKRDGHSSKGICQIYGATGYPPRHGGKRALSGVSLRRCSERSQGCRGAPRLESRSIMTSEHLHCVLSTDRKLSDEDILSYYAERWSIECFFRQSKDQLKLDGYRVRHVRAVKRY